MANIKMVTKLVDGIFISIMEEILRCKIILLIIINTSDSGGGSYDQEGTGIKIGKWVEIKGGFKWAL